MTKLEIKLKLHELKKTQDALREVETKFKYDLGKYNEEMAKLVKEITGSSDLSQVPITTILEKALEAPDA